MAGRQIQGQGGRRHRLLTPHDLAGIITNQQGFITGPVDYNSLINKPALSPVATSGNYSDLSGKPTALPPNGPAGGSLGGTYPNPSITFPITSVFGRTGSVTPASGDYTFAQIGSKPTTLGGYGITDALKNSNNLSDLTNNAAAVTNMHVGFSNVSVALTIDQTGIAINSYNTVIFNSVVIDTLSEYNSATGSFTANSGGIYIISMFVLGVGLLDGCNVVTGIFVNDIQSHVVGETYVRSVSGSTIGGTGGSTIIQLAANDVLTIRFFASDASSPYIQGVAATTYANIYRIL